MNILEKMNKSIEAMHPATLNEAVPRDLMQQIRDNLDKGTFKEFKEEKVVAFSGRV